MDNSITPQRGAIPGQGDNSRPSDVLLRDFYSSIEKIPKFSDQLKELDKFLAGKSDPQSVKYDVKNRFLAQRREEAEQRVETLKTKRLARDTNLSGPSSQAINSLKGYVKRKQTPLDPMPKIPASKPIIEKLGREKKDVVSPKPSLGFLDEIKRGNSPLRKVSDEEQRRNVPALQPSKGSTSPLLRHLADRRELLDNEAEEKQDNWDDE